MDISEMKDEDYKKILDFFNSLIPDGIDNLYHLQYVLFFYSLSKKYGYSCREIEAKLQGTGAELGKSKIAELINEGERCYSQLLTLLLTTYNPFEDWESPKEKENKGSPQAKDKENDGKSTENEENVHATRP